MDDKQLKSFIGVRKIHQDDNEEENEKSLSNDEKDDGIEGMDLKAEKSQTKNNKSLPNNTVIKSEKDFKKMVNLLIKLSDLLQVLTFIIID